ncbi:hypothetical protein BOW50_10580 [Solemya velum gill symbiont]|uniref:ComEC/Rec2 family competence protein n=1 Tax=Solemya velum gill symbiont TaxID=2340 RepID=UPI00099736CB|nr:hypothetical protein BOW48_11485 [Solemya velum gill symbiont]OOZ76061.1 hypothetical protein BOW50_10580 [Solemya velum gill symbiont]
MRVQVHDVGHGLCVSLVHDNGNVMLWDCGHTNENRPSVFLPTAGINRIDRFFVTNYDEDHISDLHYLRQNLNIQILHRNRTISREQLHALKLQSGPISTAMTSLLEMIGRFTAGVSSPTPEFPDVRYTVFHNTYQVDFNDTNNISLVTFLDCNGVTFIIPGDVETAGWQKLLENDAFRNELRGVDIFIASHHGSDLPPASGPV